MTTARSCASGHWGQVLPFASIADDRLITEAQHSPREFDWQLLKTPKLIAGSAHISSANGQFGLKASKVNRLRSLLTLALVFAAISSQASIPNGFPARFACATEFPAHTGTTTYERDQLGRVTKKTQRLINGDTRSVSYAYNANGLLASTTYPGGQALQYLYDTTGQLTGLTWAGQPVVSGITWNPLGQPTGWSWNLPGASTAIPASRSYNTAGQLTATEFSSYQYDAAGRINGITQNLWQPASTNPQDSTISEAPASWTVQYSPAGRITGFTRTTAANTPADTATFQYDANGNRSASTRNVAGTTTSRTYSGEASHNRLLGFSQTTSAGGNSASTSVTYQYNSAGDLLSDGLTRYHYDSEGRLDSATTGQGADAPTTKYAHNALGQRVFKTEPLFSSAATPGTGKNLNNLLADDGEESEQEPPGLIQQFLNFWSKLWSPSTSDAEKLGWSYVYAEDGSLLGEYGSGGSASSGTSQYLYLPTASGPMPIAAIIKGQTYAIHSDHLNTPRKLTQADGQAAWQWAYSAFGEEQPTTGAKRFTNETTTPNTGAASIPEVTFNLRYPGQYFDSETKLHYNHFRSYDGRTGRYTQGDPIGLDGGWNRFGYVEGNPLSYIDPRGLDCISANGRTACRYPGGASFNIPSTPGFPASLGPSNLFYHKYDITQRIGNADRACILTMLQKYATPGNSNGASKEGTWNNAKVGPFNNPVKSYLTNDLVTGGTLIVNMTTKGGVFADGYVARGIVGDSIHTWGEGDSPWQSPTLTGYDTQYMANEIVWGIQMAEIVKQCSCTK